MAIMLRIFMEHEYQYAKAIEFNNSDSSEDILCAKTPVSQNNLDPRSATLRSKNGSSIMEQCERNCYVGSFKDKVRPWFRDGKEITGYCWQIPCRSRPIHNLLHRYVFIQ